jgi:hypothetical protein
MIRGHCLLVEKIADTCGLGGCSVIVQSLDIQPFGRYRLIRFTASRVRSTGLLQGLTADGGVSEHKVLRFG